MSWFTNPDSYFARGSQIPVREEVRENMDMSAVSSLPSRISTSESWAETCVHINIRVTNFSSSYASQPVHKVVMNHAIGFHRDFPDIVIIA
jgi:hypothetical protein